MTATDFVRGSVLYLDPDILDDEGSSYSCREGNRVRGPHYFVCIDAGITGNGSKWLPMFSKPNHGRIAIPLEVRYGSREWTSSVSYYHPGQVWTCDRDAIAAAAMGCYKGRLVVSQQNMVDPEALPQVTRKRLLVPQSAHP
jgi:hypothetical protein